MLSNNLYDFLAFSYASSGVGIINWVLVQKPPFPDGQTLQIRQLDLGHINRGSRQQLLSFVLIVDPEILVGFGGGHLSPAGQHKEIQNHHRGDRFALGPHYCCCVGIMGPIRSRLLRFRSFASSISLLAFIASCTGLYPGQMVTNNLYIQIFKHDTRPRTSLGDRKGSDECRLTKRGKEISTTVLKVRKAATIYCQFP
ncbi:hypothetical protein SISSUDRAFT_124526 [Sistotremastrum suecicum HHB10207 ss-3]|uniref:Uncharacterized protein n=1 Tax=Sistotremastrum suecicum HHB10207 ss-3 TaxID=1314776 RepID=A0A166B0I9_9AGAM|nr:hypothetical protein SISSUDRAFT_124526 [Sistotremastrum suecicum HHB10207 ss-3]